MNILVLSWRDTKHPLAGGAEQVMHEHMKGWIEVGHNVTLFSSIVNGLVDYEKIDRVEVIRQGNQYLGVQIKAFLYYLKYKNHFDLVVDQFHGIPFFTPLYVKKPILPVLQEVAKEVWFKNPFIFPINVIVGLVGYISEPVIFLLYKNCKFMVGSNSAKEDLIKFKISSKNITIVPHGVLLPKKLPDHKVTNPKVITYFGPLTGDKGIMDAIETFSIVSLSGNCRFYIIGRPETDNYYRKVLEKIDKYKLKEKITFYKRPSDEEKFEILSKSYLLINPSIREGWGLVNIEANSVGTPVVAYNSAGLVDSVKDGYSGVIVSKNTSQKIAEVVTNLFLDKDKYNKLQKTSFLWSKKFDWKISKKISQKLISNI
jgi:glycosyltransferase involved in cell wall biosynthesis